MIAPPGAVLNPSTWRAWVCPARILCDVTAPSDGSAGTHAKAKQWDSRAVVPLKMPRDAHGQGGGCERSDLLLKRPPEPGSPLTADGGG